MKGKMVITTDDEEKDLNEGDAVYIPGNEPHALKNPTTEPSIGVDIFVPGRSFDFWLKRKQT